MTQGATRRLDHAHLGVLAVVAVALAYAALPQGIGWNQNAHYALVRSLASGTPVIDRYRGETGDVAWNDGHYYSTKAPGLAFVTVPVFLALDRSGIRGLLGKVPGASDSTVGTLWALGLVGAVLPAFALLLLVRRLAESLEPGLGTATAVTLGLGTLLLPFATLFFSHVLAAALGFAAFAVLWLEREGPPRLGLVALAGLLAGFAVTTEYPLALVALAVGLYALTRGDVGRRAALYAATFALGLLPLAFYNVWAFGSVTHLSYENAVLVGGASGHDVLGANEGGFFGVGSPSLSTASELLFSRIGPFTLAPIAAAAAVGTILLGLRGRRTEALVIASLAVGFIVYNSGYVDPFGGFSPGPRFLIPILPFLGVCLALAYRRFALPTLLLAVVSAGLMIAVTVTGPLLAHDGRWHERLADGWFSGRSWPAIVPFLLCVFAALLLTARVTTLGFSRPGAWRPAREAR